MIEGKKVYLKELSSENIDNSYLHWMNDKEITRFMDSRDNKYTINDLQEYVKTMNNSHDNYMFGIYLKNNDKYIGNIKIGSIDSSKTADIGMMIGDKSEWGKGYSSDAIACVVDFGFNTLKLKKLVAGMIKLNYGSYKAFLNNGFTKSGTKTVEFEGRTVESISVAKGNK